MTIYIYALHCPIAGLPRYIGKTKNPRTRLAAHLSKSRGLQVRHHCSDWIRAVLAAGLLPRLEVIFEVPPNERWQDHEKRLIAEYKALGYPLTNVTGGGDGFYGVSADVISGRVGARRETMADPVIREKWLRTLSETNKRPEVKAARSAAAIAAWADEENRLRFLAAMRTPEAVKNRSLATRQRNADPVFADEHAARMKAIWNQPDRKKEASDRSLAAWADPEITARRVAAIVATHNRPDVKAKMSVVNTEIGSRPEVKAAKSRALKALWSDETKRGEFLEAFGAPEVKAKQSAKRKAAWADPEVGQKLRAIHASDEVRAKKAAAAKRRATPEYRAMMAERTKAVWARRKAATES